MISDAIDTMRKAGGWILAKAAGYEMGPRRDGLVPANFRARVGSFTPPHSRPRRDLRTGAIVPDSGLISITLAPPRITHLDTKSSDRHFSYQARVRVIFSGSLALWPSQVESLRHRYRCLALLLSCYP